MEQNNFLDFRNFLHIFKSYLLFSVFIFIISSSFVSAFSINSDTYLLGDAAIISLNDSELNYQLTIITPEGSYKYLGDLQKVIPFNTQIIGNHSIELNTGNSISKLFFTVIESVQDTELTNIKSISSVNKLIPYNPNDFIVMPPSQDIFQNNITNSSDNLTNIAHENSINDYYHFKNKLKKIKLKSKKGSFEIETKILKSDIYGDDVEAYPDSSSIKKIKFKNLKDNYLNLTIDEIKLDKESLKRFYNEQDNSDVLSTKSSLRSSIIKSLSSSGASSVSSSVSSFSDSSLKSGAFASATGSIYNSFVIDASKLQFSSGTLTRTAIGEELWDCNSWNVNLNLCEGSWSKIKDITPGTDYDIIIDNSTHAYIETGVATINAKKPVYHPDEVADLVIVVLDRGGYPVNNADLLVQVTTPDNRTYSFYNISSKSKGVYELEFPYTSLEGKYDLFVSASGPFVDHQMLSEFFVKKDYSFDIIRKTPVTFDPWSGPFEDRILIKPTDDFYKLNNSKNYSFTEIIPADYEILDLNGGELTYSNGKQQITWDNLTGEVNLSILVQSPLVSPDIHVFGQGIIVYDNILFEEARPWYIAVDPLSEWKTQGDTVSFSAGVNQIDVTLNKPISDISKAFVLVKYSGDSGADAADEHQITGHLVNTTTIRLSRYDTVDTPTASYYVVENTGGDIYVQRGEIIVGSTSTSNTATLSNSVDTSRSWVIMQSRSAGSSRNDIFEGLATGELIDSTTVQCERAVTGSEMTCRYQVVELLNPNMKVQTGSLSMNSGSTFATIPNSVNTSRAFLYHTINSNDNSLDTSVIEARLTSSTRIDFRRDGTNSAHVNGIVWYVIEFPQGTRVTSGTIDRYSPLVTTNLIEDVTISAVDLNKTFAWHSDTQDGGGTAFPRPFFTNYFTSNTNLRMQRFYSGQEYYLSWQVIELPDANLIPNVTLINPLNGGIYDFSNVSFDFKVIDDSNYLQYCWIYLNDTGSFIEDQNKSDIANNTQISFYKELDDGSYLWNVICRDYYGSESFASSNFTVNVQAVASAIINDIEGDTTSVYSFFDQTPTLNITISNRNADCYLSTVDESYDQMVSGGRTNCGSFTKGISKDCTFSGTLPIGSQTLYLACNTANGVKHTADNNNEISIDVECDSHSDCTSTQYCDYLGNCAPDVIPGYNCYDLSFNGGADDQVCGDGTNSYCVNDSSYSYTGWYCTRDVDDCVYNNNGNSYDLNEVLCISGTNDYRSCDVGNTWSAIVDCADQYGPADQNAITHSGEYCAYYSADQTCNDGVGGGCIGSATDCGNYIYNQTLNLCGSILTDCDIGCGASCDSSNSTSPIIISNICYYDMSCSNACSWTQSQEVAPDYCINDFNGGNCAYNNRTDPGSGGTCYWNPTCINGDGSGLSDSGNLRIDYCDYCDATGNHSGDYSPVPNSSCTSSCANTGTIYYDPITPGNRTDDCNSGVSALVSDTLSMGDIWDGLSAATCDNTECDLDCGTLTGSCNLGICECVDTDNPLLLLLSPVNNYWTNNPVVTFNYNVTDINSGIENCSLLINNTIDQTNFSINKSLALQTFSKTFTNGSFNWGVVCYDNGTLNNINQSETRNAGVDTVLPSISNPFKDSTPTFKISDTTCLNVTASDALSGINRVYAVISTPGGSEEVDFSDAVSNVCDPTPGDGVFSVDYLIRLSGDYNWTSVYAVDKAGNSIGIPAGFFWNVTEGGFLVSNMTQPTSVIEINESGSGGVNTNYSQTCTALCDWGFVDCNGVDLNVQYNDGTGWKDISNSSGADLISDIDHYSCGDLSATQAPWWNDSFAYRQQMRINAKSAVAADHVIRVDFDTTGPKFRDDAADLRVVYWNGSENIEVDRQVFQPNSTGSSIWFVIGEALSANSSNFNYYLYYGNATADNPKNNQSNIWLFYDDFSDGTYTDKWGYTAPAGQIQITSTTNPWSGNNYVLDVGTSCGTTYTKVLTSELSPIRDMASRILWMDNPGNTCGGSSPDADGVVGLHGSATTAYDGILVERDTDTGFHYDMGATGSVPGDYSEFNIWQWSETYIYGTQPSGYKARHWDYNASEPTGFSLVATSVTATNAGQPFIRVASGRAHIAAVMVRPTVEFEPVTQIKGVEDLNATAMNNCSYTFTVTSGVNTGNNEWPIRCEAKSSNSEYDQSTSVNLTINDDPVASIVDPINGSWVTGTIIINGSSSYDLDGSITNYLFEYDDNIAFSSPSTICDGASSSCSFNTLVQNQCTNNTLDCYVRLAVTDDNGLINSSYITIGFDTNGPVTTLDEPSNFENITSNIFTVNASVFDSGVGFIDSVIFDYRENSSGVWFTACVDSDGVAPFECGWNVTNLTDGAYYELRAYANDTSGNLGGADIHTNITIDRNGPYIDLELPSNNWFTSNTNIVLNYNVTDITSDVASCSLYLDGEYNQTSSPIIEETTLNFNLNLDEGTYEWYISCIDVQGNSNISVTRNFTIDTTGPVVLLNDPATLENIYGVTSYVVNASVFDSGVGFIDSVIFDYRENSSGVWFTACVNSDGVAPFNCSWDLSSLTDGNDYQVRVRANDTLGNFGEYSTHFSITIDKTGPSINLTNPDEGYIDGDGNLFFYFIASDLASSITSCSLYFNGLLNQTNSSIIEDTPTLFNLTNITDGDYTWQIRCTDGFGQTTVSEIRNLTVDIKYIMNISVMTDDTPYHRGNQLADNGSVIVDVLDFYGGDLGNVDLVSDIIKIINFSEEVSGWWNTSWDKRKPLYVSSTSSQNRSSIPVKIDVVNLGGYINNCYELRVVSIDGTVMPYNILSGDDNTYCNIVASIDVSANVVGENNYFIYYNNSAATDPGYSSLSSFTYDLFAESFEGAWTKSTGEDPTTGCSGGSGNFSDCIDNGDYEWYATSGGFEIDGSYALVMEDWDTWNSQSGLFEVIDATTACGGDSCDDIRVTGYSATGSVDSSSEYCRVWARDKNTSSYSTIYECLGPDPACEFSDNTNAMPASSADYNLFNLTLEGDLGMSLSNYTAVHIGGRVPGGGDQCYYDDIHIIGYRTQAPYISGVSVGSEQDWYYRDSGVSNSTGGWSYDFISTDFPIGNYSVVAAGTKYKFEDAYDYYFFELIEEIDPPIITLNTPLNNTEHNSSVTFTYLVNDALSTVENCTLYIDGVVDAVDTQIEEGPVQFFYPRIPVGGPHNWWVECYDYYGNLGISENRTFIIIPPDLTATAYVADKYSAIEGQNVTITANISNIGGSNAGAFNVSFYDGTPWNGGVFIMNYSFTNLTDKFGSYSNETISFNYTVNVGTHIIHMLIDPPYATNGSIFEIYETNNNFTLSIYVPAYQKFYGNTSANIVLQDLDNDTFLNFSHERANSGFLLVAAQGSNPDFTKTYALGRTTADAIANADFSDVDSVLNMVGFNDSVKVLWGNNSDIPVRTINKQIFNRNINNIPIVNNTGNRTLYTGILWDSDDSVNDEFDTVDKEDLIFMTEIEYGTKGTYGLYDYEIQVPALLRDYKGSNVVELYVEII